MRGGPMCKAGEDGAWGAWYLTQCPLLSMRHLCRAQGENQSLTVQFNPFSTPTVMSYCRASNAHFDSLTSA